MKVVDIHNGRNKLTQELATFKESHNFDDFLEAVEYCLKNNLKNGSELETEWEAQRHTISLEGAMESFSVFLSKLKIDYPLTIIPKKEQDPSLRELINNMHIAFEKESKEQETHNDKYSWFYPAFMLREFLPQIYPTELDPGLVIGRYFHQLFPDKLSECYPDLLGTSFTPSREYILSVGSNFQTFIKKIGEAVIEVSYSDDLEKQVILWCLWDILDPDNRESRKRILDIEDIAINVMLAPKEFFYAWETCWRGQLRDDYILDDEIKSADTLVALKLFSFGKGNLPQIVFSNDDDSLKTKYLNKLSAFQKTIVNEKYLSYNDLFDRLFFVCSVAFSYDDRFNKVAINLITGLTEFRRNYIAGMFPADPEKCWGIADEIINNFGYDNLDLMFMLTEGFCASSLLSLSTRDGDSYQQRSDYFNLAQRYYLCIFNKAVEEGLPEFAVSLLSLYILLRTLKDKARFANLPKLISAIDRALSLPGGKILKHTLSFVVYSIDKFFYDDPIAVCSANYFRPYLSKPAELHAIEGGSKGFFDKKQREGSVREFFETEYGVERWAKLSENSRKCLISAELQWRNSAVEFGFGIKDWSGLITTYCKAIEGELVDRLSDFFVSAEYNTYLTDKGLKRPTKPTAGWLLKELKSYENMPLELQTILEKTRIRLAGENDLVNRLYDIVQNYRNISAHHDAVPMKRFAEFKEKLFQSGLLHKFIDAFC